MTPKQLQAIRKQLDKGYSIGGCFIDAVCDDLRALLDEVERLKNELAMTQQVSGELCEKCGWAMRFPNELCRCELQSEVERLRDALTDIASGDYSDPFCMKTPEARARAALEIK